MADKRQPPSWRVHWFVPSSIVVIVGALWRAVEIGGSLYFLWTIFFEDTPEARVFFRAWGGLLFAGLGFLGFAYITQRYTRLAFLCISFALFLAFSYQVGRLAPSQQWIVENVSPFGGLEIWPHWIRASIDKAFASLPDDYQARVVCRPGDPTKDFFHDLDSAAVSEPYLLRPQLQVQMKISPQFLERVCKYGKFECVLFLERYDETGQYAPENIESIVRPRAVGGMEPDPLWMQMICCPENCPD